MRRHDLITICLAVSVFLLTPLDAFGQGRTFLDDTFLDPEAGMVVVVRPKLLCENSPEHGMVKEMVEELGEELGLDVTKIESLVLQFALGKDEPFDDDQLIIKIHHSEVIDHVAIAEPAWRATRQEDLNGRPFYLRTNDPDACFYLPDDQTLLLTLTDRIKALAAAPLTMGPLVSRVRAIEPDSEVAVVLRLEEGRNEALIDELFGDIPPIDDFVVANMVRKLDWMVVEAQFTSDVPITAELITPTGELASEIAAGLEGMLQLGRETLPELSKQIVEHGPPSQREAMGVMFDAFNSIVSGTTMEVDGNVVSLTVENEGGLQGLLTAAGLTIFGFQEPEMRPLEIEGGIR